MVDLSHMMELHETVDQCVDPVAPYIRHVHLANSMPTQGKAAYGDQHPRLEMPYGAVDAALAAKLLEKLLAIGYPADGKPWGDEDSVPVVTSTKRFMADVWAKVWPNTEREAII